MSMFTVSREDRVAEFNTKAENKTAFEGGSIGQHVACFNEEIEELAEAMADYVLEQTEENRAKMIKEWADVQVTLSNLAWFFEFDGQAAFNRVADNNMTKLVGGKLVRREDGKILKPEGYVKPDMSGL